MGRTSFMTDGHAKDKTHRKLVFVRLLVQSRHYGSVTNPLYLPSRTGNWKGLHVNLLQIQMSLFLSCYPSCAEMMAKLVTMHIIFPKHQE